MLDLCITIVEEHTKRFSRNLALTQTRRRTITIEEEPPTTTTTTNNTKSTQQKQRGNNTATTTTSSTTTTTTTTTTKVIRDAVRGKCSIKPPTTTRTTTTTREILLPRARANCDSDTWTVAVPGNSNLKVWTEKDKQQNLLLHIKTQRERRDWQAPRSI